MRKRFVSLVVLGLAFAGTASAAWLEGTGLAHRLPERTVAYAEVDVGRALDSGLAYLRFIDPERAEEIASRTGDLLDCLKELSGHYEFQPEILDRLDETRLFFVVMAKDEPEVKTHTYKSRKWDRERGQFFRDEFEEHTVTTRKEYAISLVVETPGGEIAADFMAQLTAVIERLHEEEGGEGRALSEIEVERGEMIGSPEGDVTVGRFESYLVLSDTNPVELWAALVAPADPSLAETRLYSRYAAADVESTGSFLVNLQVLLGKLEESLVRDLEEAEEKFGPVGGEGFDDEGGFNPGAWRVRNARSKLDAFNMVKELLSLDKMKAAGMHVGQSVGDEVVESRVTTTLHLGEPVSPALGMILDGGHALTRPGVGEREGIQVCLRLGLKEIFEEVTANLPPEQQGALLMATGAIKMQTGYDLAELLGGLSGDVYVFVDLVEKEIEKPTWDRESGEMEMKKVVTPSPEVLVLVGLNDREAFSEVLSNIFTKLSAAPGIGALVDRRTFLGTDVYVAGSGMGVEGAVPDGLTSFAAAVVGRHLGVGSWKDVTGLIRRASAGGALDPGSLAAAIADHPDANILAVVPNAFSKKVQEMMEKEGENPLQEISKALKNLPLPTEDEEMARRLRSSIEKLLAGLIGIGEKAQDRTSDTIGWGRYSGNFYEITAEAHVRK